jgi:hypothetical protein
MTYIPADMNNAEARSVLKNELAKYRAKHYLELVALIGNPQTLEVLAPSGVTYQVEVEAMWDHPKKPNGVLRVVGSVDDGGIRAFVPLTDSFLLTPTGEFVGE